METLKDRDVLAEITSRYQALASLVPLHAIRSEQDYENAISILNRLLDAGAANDEHLLADLVNALGNLIGDYEDQQHPAEPVTPVEMIRFLMEQHRLSQSDLPEIGGQSVVSEILSGKRQLNLRQIRELSERFKLPAAVFL